MTADERPLRADAERNRRRLLDSAEALFTERGLDVGVGEIAQHAGIGRATLFRNFSSKDQLIAAIVVERMTDAADAGRELLSAPDPGRRCSPSSRRSSGASSSTGHCSKRSATRSWPTPRSGPPMAS